MKQDRDESLLELIAANFLGGTMTYTQAFKYSLDALREHMKPKIRYESTTSVEYSKGTINSKQLHDLTSKFDPS